MPQEQQLPNKMHYDQKESITKISQIKNPTHGRSSKEAPMGPSTLPAGTEKKT